MWAQMSQKRPYKRQVETRHTNRKSKGVIEAETDATQPSARSHHDLGKPGIHFLPEPPQSMTLPIP